MHWHASIPSYPSYLDCLRIWSSLSIYLHAYISLPSCLPMAIIFAVWYWHTCRFLRLKFFNSFNKNVVKYHNKFLLEHSYQIWLTTNKFSNPRGTAVLTNQRGLPRPPPIAHWSAPPSQNSWILVTLLLSIHSFLSFICFLFAKKYPYSHHYHQDTLSSHSFSFHHLVVLPVHCPLHYLCVSNLSISLSLSHTFLTTTEHTTYPHPFFPHPRRLPPPAALFRFQCNRLNAQKRKLLSLLVCTFVCVPHPMVFGLSFTRSHHMWKWNPLIPIFMALEILGIFRKNQTFLKKFFFLRKWACYCKSRCFWNYLEILSKLF